MIPPLFLIKEGPFYPNAVQQAHHSQPGSGNSAGEGRRLHNVPIKGLRRRTPENIIKCDSSHLHQVMKKVRLVNLLFGNQNTFISSYNC